jgi:hypothetical protein
VIFGYLVLFFFLYVNALAIDLLLALLELAVLWLPGVG